MAIPLAESLKLGLADIMLRKVRSVVTVIGIILGVMCIMVVLAIVNGMNKSTKTVPKITPPKTLTPIS